MEDVQEVVGSDSFAIQKNAVARFEKEREERERADKQAQTEGTRPIESAS